METYSSPIPRASSSAFCSSSISSVESAGALDASPVTVGSASSASLARRRTRLRIGARAAQHRHDDAAVLLEQREQQVLGDHLRVAARAGEAAAAGREGLLGLDCESISLHRKSKSMV